MPDTSIWIEYLRNGQAGSAWHLDDLLQSESVLVCGPVAAELLAGAADGDRETLWSALQALPWAPLGRTEWRQVGDVAAQLRGRGRTVPLTDLEIAVGAAAASAAVWTRDGDFERIAEVLIGLQLFSPP